MDFGLKVHFTVHFSSAQQGAAAKKTANNKTPNGTKYQELKKTYIFFPVRY